MLRPVSSSNALLQPLPPHFCTNEPVIRIDLASALCGCRLGLFFSLLRVFLGGLFCIVNTMMGGPSSEHAYLIIYCLFIEWYRERRGTTSSPELLLEI